MKRALGLLMTALTAQPPSAWAVVIDKYAWEFPRATSVAGADDLITDLQEEVQKILNAGHLAPIYISYADQDSAGYKVYQEPGRIITTLAWAYPYLTDPQKTAVRAYAAAELADARFAPWGPYPMPDMVGTPRELHLKTQWWYSRSGNFLSRPSVQTIYGLWLYGHRSGDWALIQNNWNSIKTMYGSRAGQGNLYGTMGAHVAMARLAHRFNDAAMRTTALNNLQTQLDAGLNFSTVENNATDVSPFPYTSAPDMYDGRMDGSTYRGWIFLNVTPEIGRYLNEESATLKSAVLARHAQGLAVFPYWWINKANYFIRSWVGDEGMGLVPDVFGMYAPIERWVAGANAAALKRQMKSAPTGLGDCYWLEALVQAIEAHGTLAWADVRNTAVDTAPPVPPKNLRRR